MRALVVINPVSGPRRRRDVGAWRALAIQTLTGCGVEVEVAITAGPGDARQLAARAQQAGVDMVIAWGGDGTVNEVASALARTSTALGIVPAGSGNGLARELGLPRRLAAALTVAARGQTRRIDAGRLGDAWFFNVAGVGLDAAIARRLTEPGVRRGLAGYVQATVAELPRHRAERLTLRVDGAGLTLDAMFIALANTRQYGHGATIAPRARIDDGRLDVVMVEAQPLWRALSRLPALFLGTLQPARGIRMERFAALDIAGDGGPIRYHVDGEPGQAGARVTATVAPGALLVSCA